MRKDGIFNQIRETEFAEDPTWPALNDFWEAAFETEGDNKHMFIGMVNPQPGNGGGSIMWRRKKRFLKKRIQWMYKVRDASMVRFFGASGIKLKDYGGEPYDAGPNYTEDMT